MKDESVPRGNTRGERTIRDLKDESGLGRDIALPNADEAAGRVAAACARLAARARISHEPLPPAVRYTPEQREYLYEAVCCRVAAAVLRAPSARPRCLAEGEAVHAVLEGRGLIRGTRGGAPPLPSEPEIISRTPQEWIRRPVWRIEDLAVIMRDTAQHPRSSSRAPITPFGVSIGLGIVLVVGAVGWSVWTTVVGVREEVSGIVESRKTQAACELRLLDARWMYTLALFDEIVRRVKVDPEADDGGLPRSEQFGIVGAVRSDADGGSWTVVVDNIAVFRMSRVPRSQELAADVRNAAKWIVYSWRCDDLDGMSAEYDRRSRVAFALLSDGQVRWAMAPRYCGIANAPSVTAAMTARGGSELATDEVGADGEIWRTGSPDQFLSAGPKALDGGDANSIKLADGR